MDDQALSAVRFFVARQPPAGTPRPVIGVDGPVRGADRLYDHHASGERVNLLALPAHPPYPGSIGTTMLDGDAIISAAVLLLRAMGEHDRVAAAWPVLHEAAHWCDWLQPSGAYPDAARAGLGLHCWLKERGFGLREVLALAHDSTPAVEGPVPGHQASAATLGRAFRALTLALVNTARRGTLPDDQAYLSRLDAMVELARAAITEVRGAVSAIAAGAYIDPLALYQVLETDVCLQYRELPTGRAMYKLGVHPRAYARVDLRVALQCLARREQGWGGRANAGGSPLGEGSALTRDAVIDAVNVSLDQHRGGAG